MRWLSRRSKIYLVAATSQQLFRVDGGWAVFVFDDGRARRRQIKVGQRNGLVAQIINGLEEGDLVINHPSDTIEEGSRVRR